MKELEEEGGIPARSARYRNNNLYLIAQMRKMGFRPFIDTEAQGPIITTFYYPENTHYDFAEMYQYIKDRGYAIYPGKLTDADTFRIGHIGEIYQEDMEKLCEIIRSYMEEKRHEI